MRIIEEITKAMLDEALKEFVQARSNLLLLRRAYMEQELRQKGLDKNVVFEGKRGIIKVEQINNSYSYEYKFYHYTKAGDISKLSNGYIRDDLSNIYPAD